MPVSSSPSSTSPPSALTTEGVASLAAQRKSEYYHLLYSEIEERKRAERRTGQRNDLLNALSQAHLRYVAQQELPAVLADLLHALLQLTGSELGLIGEIRAQAAPEQALHILASSAPDMPDGAAYRRLTQRACAAGLQQEAYHIADPAGLDVFVGLPFRVEGDVSGVLALANRPSGYDEEMLELMQPVVSTCAQLLVAERNEQRRQQAEQELAQERASLAQRVSDRTAQLSTANAELAYALRIKDEFMATMNHELRTPLNTILILTDVLRQEIYGPLNDKQRENLHDIEDSGRHLLVLITDILDIVKINAGKLDLDISTLSVQELCESSMRLTEALAAKQQIQVSLHIDPAVQEIDADDRRLKQIMLNLLSNAVKFTPDGGQVGLDVQGNPATNTVIFTVWDTGIGIATEQMDQLFKPFAQLDSSLSRQYEGSGLGLALAARMAELCGGSIAVESEVGRGSRFTVSLPWHREDALPILIQMRGPQDAIKLAPAAPQPAHAASNRPAAAKPARSRSLVLLAEDNEANVHALRDFLEHQGYTLLVARTGREALEVAQSERPDIILMDIQMPDMDGLQAIRRLRADPSMGDLPIIAVTALVLPGERERCLAAGANDFIGKPISIPDLTNAIRDLLHTQPVAHSIA